MAVTTDLSPCSRSVLVTYTVCVTKQHLVNISFLKTSTAHFRGTIGLVFLESKYKMCTLVLSQNKLYVLARVRAIKSLGLAALCLYFIFVKTRVQIFYFLILNRSPDFLLYTT